MAGHLPYDIWCLIASFLPRSELMRLYGVNSAFFNMVMDDKYRKARVYHVDDEETKRWLRDVKYAHSPLHPAQSLTRFLVRPLVAKRVRNLELRPHLFALPSTMPLVLDDVPPKLQSPRWFKQLLQDILRSKPRRLSSSALLLHNISKMTAVTSLTIGCYPSDDVHLFKKADSLAFIRLAWSAHASQLQTLTLSIPLEANDAVLKADPPFFDSLQTLNLTLRTESIEPIPVHTDILRPIVTFVDRHSQTLTRLSVDTPEATVNSYTLFSTLRDLTRLTELSICHPWDHLRPSIATGVDTFLSRHAAYLESLSIWFGGIYTAYPLPSPDILFSHPILRTQLPSLKSLDLSLCQWPRAQDQALGRSLVRYIQPLHRTLEKLVIRNCVLTLRMVADLAAILGTPEAQLISLEIDTYFLSCELLDVLSQRLPNLVCLTLYFQNITGRDDGSQNPHYGQYLLYVNVSLAILERRSDVADVSLIV